MVAFGRPRPKTLPLRAGALPLQAEFSAPVRPVPEDAPRRDVYPQVSVIIVNYNGGAYLGTCLRSLLAGGGPTCEVIVVDNASTDGSADAVARLFPEVRLIRSAANLGFGAGNNLGAEAARGGYLAFLNPDTVVAPGWIEALIAALEADPAAGMATAKILLLDAPDCINACGNTVHITGLTLCRGMGLGQAALPYSDDVDAVSGAAFVMRRDLFTALGGFDGSFFMYMEDTDLSWRARLAGYRCRYVPEAVIRHDYRLRFGPRKTFFQERNRYLMLLKSLRWPSLLALLPALLLAELLTWGFVLLREPGRWANKIQAYIWVARHWDTILRQRQQTQALRRVNDRALLERCAAGIDYAQTGDGLAARLAAALCDPLFGMLKGAALSMIRW